MTYEEILGFLAPCGLSCRKCFAHVDGDVGRLSAELRHGLGNFDVYAERFSAFLPAFRDYPAFRDLLAYLAEPDCKGCREGTCKYPDCGVVDCFREKGVYTHVCKWLDELDGCCGCTQFELKVSFGN